MSKTKRIFSIFLFLLLFTSFSGIASAGLGSDQTQQTIEGVSSSIGSSITMQTYGSLVNPTIFDFIDVFTAAFDQLFKGNTSAFFGLLILASPLIGIFLLLYMMGSYVGSITIFRSGEHEGYRKLFGWGIALIGISTQSVFNLLYGLVGTSMVGLIFTILIIFTFVILFHRLSKERKESKTESLNAEKGLLGAKTDLEESKKQKTEAEEAEREENIIEKEEKTDQKYNKFSEKLSLRAVKILRALHEITKNYKEKLNSDIKHGDEEDFKKLKRAFEEEAKKHVEEYENLAKEIGKLDKFDAKSLKDMSDRLNKLLSESEKVKKDPKLQKSVKNLIERIEPLLSQDLKLDEQELQIIKEHIEKAENLKIHLENIEEITINEHTKQNFNTGMNEIIKEINELYSLVYKKLKPILLGKDKLDVEILKDIQEIEKLLEDTEKKL